MNIGFKIRKLRENKKMSQNELALQLGISQTTLHNIETGNSHKIDFLLMLFHAFKQATLSIISSLMMNESATFPR